jgi:hypothetical protein
MQKYKLPPKNSWTVFGVIFICEHNISVRYYETTVSYISETNLYQLQDSWNKLYCRKTMHYLFLSFQ